MEWREDVRPARAGDSGARERLREYLTPFAHGVCLASAPHHVTQSLVARVLDQALSSLGGVDEADVGLHVMGLARRAAKLAATGALEEQASSNPALNDARQALGRLRALPETTRERFLLRVVEGIPGPELAELLRVGTTELRADLERGATEAGRAFGQASSFAGDGYLWDLSGSPPPLLAQLELQRPVLRFDPTAAPLPLAAADSAGTFQELKPVGAGLGGPMKGLLFDDGEDTSVSQVTASPPNPFEPQARTVAATDLPAEAAGQVPPRPVPTVKGGDVSGKSISGKSGRSNVIVETGKSGKVPAHVSRSEPTKAPLDLDESTEARVPALALAHQQERNGPPQGMLGQPTMNMPLGSAIAAPETRINPIPLEAITSDGQHLGRFLQGPAAPPGVLDAPALAGSSPLFIAFGLMSAALVVYALSLFASERQSRSGWQLTQVVVASEDISFGDLITIDNVALRSVPPEFVNTNVVKDDALNNILDQRLLADVQTGDPIFWSQFASTKASQHLSARIVKRGRGYTIPLSTSGAVGRWVRPGDSVDLVVAITATDKAQGSNREPRAVTILQRVRVMATGKADSTLAELALDARERQFSDVTILLTPEEAEVVALASTMGRLSLTLRNEDDDEVEFERGFTNAQTLLDGRRRQALEARRRTVIQSIRTAPGEPTRPTPNRR